MSQEQRVRKLEDEIGEVVVRVKYIFGGRFFRDCEHYQDQSCKRVAQEPRQSLPEGAKIRFEIDPEDANDENPCNDCMNYKERVGKS